VKERERGHIREALCIVAVAKRETGGVRGEVREGAGKGGLAP